MNGPAGSNHLYFLQSQPTDLSSKPIPGHLIKTESSPSPAPPFSFVFGSPPTSNSQSTSRSEPASSADPRSPLFTFQSPMSWHAPNSADAHTGVTLQENDAFDIANLQNAMAFGDDYDDLADLVELAPNSSVLSSLSGPGLAAEKTIRRRSSKACDQCRKSKCKCERSSLNEPCRSCVLLGTQCTFLGPSRKRGPPKGYIDAIEARLHQTEALLGIMLATTDERAQTLLRDLATDPLAKEIIKRVDNSSYGSKGHKRAESNSKIRPTHPIHTQNDSESHIKTEGQIDLHTTHPSNEWQDQVTAMLEATVRSRSSGDTESHPPLSAYRPPLYVVESGSNATDASPVSPNRRQRRRVGTDDLIHINEGFSQPPSGPLTHRTKPSLSSSVRSLSPLGQQQRRSSTPIDSYSSDSEEDFAVAVGQLSLNEDEQVRYHGKVSGLHLLGSKDRIDQRNEGGIWRFPKAGVWPPLPPKMRNSMKTTTTTEDDNYASQLPEPAVQEHLLDLYFTYVHPSFPIIHKRTFFEIYRSGNQEVESPHSPASSDARSSGSSPFNRRPRRIPTLLLLAMFAIAARYSSSGGDNIPPQPPDGSMMWAAGDDYLDRAKVILDSSYASSRSSTCQSLLLMGYREIGIGAMAQAWCYIGMAVRMAQDLGMHRSADGWARVGLGGRLFAENELQERKRIWYGCVIMDKYVSTYIGRPLSIFERDFDTLLPNENEPEELEEWKPYPSPTSETNTKPFTPVPARIISCFNASAELSGIISAIVQAIYAVHPVSSRHVESVRLETLLDKWYIELPEHLRHEPGSSKHPLPLPHILTLHMQYWCAVLLLHRPFIRHSFSSPKCKHSTPDAFEDGDSRAFTAEKSYEMCAAAANHIASIVSIYIENYSLDRSAVFLCYYIFTAGIMHVTTLSTYPADPQAYLGLTKCMEALKKMEVVWPSAGRALELLAGSKVNLKQEGISQLSHHTDRHKRPADQPLDVEDVYDGTRIPNNQTIQPPSQATDDVAVYPNGQGIFANYVELQPDVSSFTNPFPSYERWPSDNNNAHHPFTTSVHPQQYSTGFVDDRASSWIRVHSDAQGQCRRYPQYWNDYSTFPQLATTYNGMPMILDQVQQQQQQQQQQGPFTSSSMFIPEQYNLYTNQPQSNS